MQRIWILSELFYPDETSTSFILTKIANHMAKKARVQVITASTDNAQPSASFSLNPLIKVKRVQKWLENKNNLLIRFINFIHISIALTYILAKKVKKNDKVFIVTNPVPLILLVTMLKKITPFKLYVLVHDVFPENTISAGIIKKRTGISYRLMSKAFTWAYLQTDKIIVLGRDMREVFIKKSSQLTDKLIIIENWGDIENIYPHKEHISDEKLIIQYAGNIGRVQGLMELLKFFKKADNPLVHLHIYGEGILKKKLQQWVLENNVRNVCFFSGYKREDQNRILNSCNIAIVSLAEGMFGLGVPSKTYNIMAAGKPILYIGEKNTEVDLLIKENGIGYSFQQNEANKIISFLKNLHICDIKPLQEMGQIARTLVETKFSENIILNKFIDTFEQ